MEHSDGADPVAVIAQRVKEVRGRKGFTAQQLADKLRDKTGLNWDRATVTKLETGRRQTITVVELLALARVLDVAPVNLLVPLDDRPFAVTAKESVAANRVRAWVRGESPLSGTDQRIFRSEVPIDELPVPGRLTAQGRAFVDQEREKHRAATGRDLDDNALLNRMFGATEREEGPDGEHQEETER
ncbi:helix-turn-helix domain-containing protein [Streptomyces sp. NPDC048462]|uniref:helix-turn-helix domain-containing protein n=1 Tax=Streptomyces sp. NPDC048462 TaxID=3365555 RepID=UPI00371E9AF1